MEAIHCRKCQHVSLDDSTESWNLALFIKDFSSVLLSMPFLKTVLKSQVWVLFLLTTFFAQVHLWYYSSRPGAPSLFLRKVK